MKTRKPLLAALSLVLLPALPATGAWTAIEKFETADGFVVGNTINGIHGWVVDVSASAVAANDPAASGHGTVARVIPNATRNDIYKALGAANQIANGTMGTVFFEVFLPLPAAASNTSIGLSDVAAPNDFASLEPQFRFLNSDISPRNGAAFVDTTYDFDSGRWLKVWLVVDNTADNVDMYVRTPTGQTSRIKVADNFGFRNGVAANAMLTFVLIQGAQAASQEIYFDNIYVDPNTENLTDPSIVDTDSDGMDDNWENSYFTNLSRDGSLDFDGDELSDLLEFERATLPNDQDTDNDDAWDGKEVKGTSNAFNGQATDPLDSDTDNDGVLDGAENGVLNTQFANAPTNPRAADSDADGMNDAYELSCNSSSTTALNPNDNGTTDPTQAPTADRDGDTLTNLAEFNAVNRTRADLKDTDGDEYFDNVEDGLQTWTSINATGTNPTRADTDGDGIKDGKENIDLGAYQGTGIYPSFTNPNMADSDFDQWGDKYEVEHGTDPMDAESKPATQPAGFHLVENFEGAGMTLGQTFNGVNGWTSLSPAQSLVADEPIAGGDKVAAITYTGTTYNSTFKSLDQLGMQVMEGNTGTIFMQVYFSGPEVNASLGLSDQPAPAAGDFGAFEAQATAFRGAITRVRDAGVFRDVSTFRTGEWTNVWIVTDNAADTVKVYWESPVGQTGQVELTGNDGGNPFNFRNGTSSALQTVLLMYAIDALPGSYALVDNIYVDSTAANLNTPAAAKPLPVVAPPVITSISRNGGGNIVITFTPGGAGYILTSSNNLVAPFTQETNAIYDGIDTFTVPAAFVNPGMDFFRVEEP